MIEKIQKSLGLVILALYPIMQFISFGGIRFNVAITDFLLPLYFFLCLLGVKRFPIKKNLPFVAYFLCYGFVVMISNCYNFSSGVGTYGMAGLLSELVKIVTCFGYFIVAYNSFDDEKSFSYVMYAWLIGLWIFMIYGLMNINGRFLGTFTDANGAGNYLVFSFFVMLLLMMRIKSEVLRSLVYFTQAIVLLCILATQSRGTWVGLAVGLGLLLVVFWRKLYKFLVIVLPLLVIALLLFVKMDFDKDYALSSSITSRFNEAVEGEGQFVIRKNLTLESLMMGMDYPVIGVGKGNFNLNSKPYADLLYDKSKNDLIYREMIRCIPHNTFVGMFAELGVVGFAVFSSIFVFWVFKLFRRQTAINKVLLIAFFAFGVQSLVLCLENARVLWIFLALALGMQDVELSVASVDKDDAEGLRVQKGYLNKGVVVLTIFTGAIFLYTAAHITKYIEVNDTAMVFEIPYQQGLKVTYSIKSLADRETASLSYVKFYKNTIADENLIRNRVYLDAAGYETIDITNEEAEHIQVVFQQETGEGSLVIRNLYYEDAVGRKHSLMNYSFVPDMIEPSLSSLLQVRTYDESTVGLMDLYQSDGRKHLSDYLTNLDEDKLLLVSVRDEASRALDGETVVAFRNFGINFKLPYQTRFAYIAVLSKAAGFEALELISETKVERLEFSFVKGTTFGSYHLPFDLEMTSAGYEAGNLSNIKLDGMEYSKQSRGLNMVVYDMKENRVIDAFVVDTYLSSFYE